MEFRFLCGSVVVNGGILIVMFMNGIMVLMVMFVMFIVMNEYVLML